MVGRTPPPITSYGIRSTSGQYASYWNAFLYKLLFIKLFASQMPYTVTNWNGVENIFVAENQIFGIMKLQAFCSKKQENACESVKHSTDSAILKWALDFPLYICSIHLHALTTGHLQFSLKIIFAPSSRAGSATHSHLRPALIFNFFQLKH